MIKAKPKIGSKTFSRNNNCDPATALIYLKAKVSSVVTTRFKIPPKINPKKAAGLRKPLIATDSLKPTATRKETTDTLA